MGRVLYPDFADTIPSGPTPLTTAQIIAHTKRPYVARGLDLQGRRDTPARIPAARTVNVPGLLLLGLAVLCIVAWAAALTWLVAAAG